MKTRCFEVQSNGTLQTLPAADLRQALARTHEGDLWIDAIVEPADDIRDVLRPLQLSERIVAACMEPGRSLRFESRKRELYMEYPVQSDSEGKVLSYVSIVMTPRRLLTIHRRPVSCLSRFGEELGDELLSHGQGSPGLLIRILVELGRESMEALLEIRNRADEITQILDDRPDSVATDDVIVLKRQADVTATAFLDQIYCFSRLSTTESDVFSARAQGEQFREILDRVRLGVDYLDRIERRLEMLVNQYHLVLQDKSNYRLQVLTIVSAIFLPLTLIAGIYGMNFERMPSLQHPYGYPITLGVMVAIAVGMLTFFKIRRWF